MAVVFNLARCTLTNCLGGSSASAASATRRFVSYRANCAEDDSPRCAPGKLDDKDCEDPREQSWYNPNCCTNPCKDALPRFDDLYYRESDKSKRKYTQTWVECPEIKVIPKKVCCFDQVKLPPMERRPRKVVPPTACALLSEDFQLWMKCRNRENLKCMKTVMPGCRGSRDPPKCNKDRSPCNCKRRCTPTPSFSECSRLRPKPLRMKECSCLKLGPWCSFGHLPIKKW